jgi:hypothetical protein
VQHNLAKLIPKMKKQRNFVSEAHSEENNRNNKNNWKHIPQNKLNPARASMEPKPCQSLVAAAARPSPEYPPE